MNTQIILIGAVTLVFAGCNPAEWLKQKTNPATGMTATASPSAAQSEVPSVAAGKAKANAELLREMHYSVFGEAPTNRAEFGNMLDSMNQGASLEGVYNGFTHSANYRKLETDNPGALPEAVKLFAEELAQLELELPVPAEFTADSAKPLELINAADENPSGVESINFPKKKTAEDAAAQSLEIQKAALLQKYSKIFAKSSIYTLKRVLGDEALKVIEAKKDKEDLATWYGKWATKMAGLKVDFGIPQRNLADEQFHSKWAITADGDQIRWEVLNRIHRALMSSNGKKS
ncbi:MAG TPA: hypothetical protein DCS07_16725 [Bdellovibrionales bacterium]|nr:MAG: hypothetical protein A2Z97_16295 [Bdellovibrionales bacterium GWB1_52_6]OFZ04552.1 MAG: hypothetical protein A2X97_13085 [Bdellovibrionales bacterium GWA1_52_35]OFZ41497.1 MAG: hypothetical protein A2070_09765 [Bdellovibrionales bacterium GWC1_52_8]HAR44249.1 hypothetical protein [Bdellovibrionales bacterium]HCM39960.1 hypothetical protein [Bdellovibrionales bacterium]